MVSKKEKCLATGEQKVRSCCPLKHSSKKIQAGPEILKDKRGRTVCLFEKRNQAGIKKRKARRT